MLALLIALKWPLVILQMIISPILIIMILLQSGKGDDIGSALGGGGNSGTVLGAGGASKFLVRGTAIFVVLFMLNSIVLAKIFKEISSSSVGTSAPQPLVPATAPASPETPAAPATQPAPAKDAAPVAPAPAPAKK